MFANENGIVQVWRKNRGESIFTTWFGRSSYPYLHLPFAHLKAIPEIRGQSLADVHNGFDNEAAVPEPTRDRDEDEEDVTPFVILISALWRPA